LLGEVAIAEKIPRTGRQRAWTYRILYEISNTTSRQIPWANRYSL